MKIFKNKSFRRSNTTRFLAWTFLHNPVDLASIALTRRRPSKGKRRVVFARVDGLGDYVLWSSTFGRVKELFPSSEYERILVGNELWRELAEGEDTFDQKIFINRDKLILSPSYRFSVMRGVRTLGADICVNPRLTRDFLWSDSLVRCSGAAVRIGSEGFDNLMSPLQERISNRWYTKLTPRRGVDEHELYAALRFLSAAGGNGNGTPQPKIPLIARATTVEFPIDRDYAVFFLGAQTPDRRWPIAKVAETAGCIARAHGLSIVLAGGPGDRDQVKEFASLYSGEFVDLVGKTKLSELNRLIGEAKIVVSNDTGGAHIAASMGVPTVVITPGNQVDRFFPYPESMVEQGVRQISVFHEMPCFGCGWTCIYDELGPTDPKPCIGDIQVENVIVAVDELLAGGAGKRRRVIGLSDRK